MGFLETWKFFSSVQQLFMTCEKGILYNLSTYSWIESKVRKLKIRLKKENMVRDTIKDLRHFLTRTNFYPNVYLHLFILVCYFFHSSTGFKDYHTCLDVKNDLGSKAVDGEYILYLSWLKNVGVNIYCHSKCSLSCRFSLKRNRKIVHIIIRRQKHKSEKIIRTEPNTTQLLLNSNHI